MTGPPLSVGLIQSHPAQPAACINFELAHHSLRRNLGFDHSVHVSRAHVGRQKMPAPMRTCRLNRIQNNLASPLVQSIGNLMHALLFGCDASGVYFEDGSSGRIVLAIHRAGFVAM